MFLSAEIESTEDMTIEEYHILMLKYENLITELPFEDIPMKIKTNVSKSFTDAERFVPVQMNGIIANHAIKKRHSADLQIISEIV